MKKVLLNYKSLNQKKISESEFENIKNKNDVTPKYLEEFTTNFWEEF